MKLIAQAISLVFHPFIVAAVTIVLALDAFWGDWVKAFSYGLIGILALIFPGVLYTLKKFLKNPALANFSIRNNRFDAYELPLGVGILFLAGLLIFQAPKILSACLAAGLLTLALLAILNTKTKVSLHLAAMGGAAAILFFISPLGGIIAALFALPVAWARLYLKEHTLVQTILGWLSAVASVALVFGVYLGYNIVV